MAVIATIGFFDGVHLGHRRIVDALTVAARERGTESLVITFWPHPRAVLQKEARGLRFLSSLQEKREMLLALGVDRVEVLPFSKEFSLLKAEDFIRDVLIGQFGVTTLVLGYDNRLGNDQLSGEDIAALARSIGVEVVSAGAVEALGDVVSSTKIRQALLDGRVDDAAGMLGYRYFLSGVVVEGNRLGRTIGFPTANMQLYDPLRQLPSPGVYAVRVHTVGNWYWGMTNIGTRPTVSDKSAVTIETNIFDFDDDIYGLDIRVEFVRRIRDEKPFPNVMELSAQLSRDRELICGEIIPGKVSQ